MTQAGASAIDITPLHPVQLAGYPFVERMSTGVHDPLLASVLYLHDGKNPVLFVSCDLIYVGKETASHVRNRIQQEYGIPSSHIMITATHTHSGPATVDFIAGSHDELLQPVNQNYLLFLETRILEAVSQAVQKTEEVSVWTAHADITGVGSNRHDPAAASDMNAPIILVRRKTDASVMACMVVCSMHPTVLHEDSTLLSGDFPGITRKLLKEEYFSTDTVFIFQMGTAGNQSPRHVTKGNTFQEATRLANILTTAIIKGIAMAQPQEKGELKLCRAQVKLHRKRFPPLAQAENYVQDCSSKLHHAIQNSLPSQAIRSAEVNWFGAKEMAYLSQLAANGQLEEVYLKNEMAEILVFKLGSLTIVGWPGEIFVEYGLEIKKQFPGTAVITLVNGELQGYIVTPEAMEKGLYEASNAIFDASSGTELVTHTKELIKTLQ